MFIEKATQSSVGEIAKLALKLWPDHSWEELKAEFVDLLKSEKDIVFSAVIEHVYVGFIHMSLRVDYVEGSSSSPVGYVEGIYVEEDYRKKGISRKLVEKGEQWAKSLGCKEIASDTWLDNEESQLFHKKIGFKEAAKIVAFIKNID